MSHVGEGALHAYLDGALDEYPSAEADRIREHLDSCAECAQRLEAERSVRSDAHAMLGMATPEVDLPSLEELRAYVRRTRPTRTIASVRVTRMSWAASVVLALGTGWMLRGGALEQPSSENPSVLARASVPSAERDNAEPSSAELRAAQAVGLNALEDDVSSSFARAEAAARLAAADEGSNLSREVFADRADLPTEAVAKSTAPDVVEAEDLQEELALTQFTSGAASLDNAGLAEAAAPTPAASEMAASAPALELAASGDGAGARAVPSDMVAEMSLAGRVDDGLTSASLGLSSAGATADADSAPTAEVEASAEVETDEEAKPERRRAESPVAVTSAMNRSGRGGIREVPENDERFNDEPSQAVPGFDVVSIENIGDDRVFNGTVVIQRLEGEEMLQIFHLERGVDLTILPPLDPNLNEVRVEAESGWVVLRGPRSEDELEVLLTRLFPE